ncbi:MerR family transcriptional regulator [Microbulbifer sp. THAF38]|uniref:MerR family transcriptional regulator n=1 Tax=Microbulbifer sp. THAF38 TaxID=2587856 RepID=UPI0012686C5C|nr:MerR family transcriptional regulator [Microbulbifer sp. THAF38]QFT53638.1 HTH-type transcriptional repressor YcgE [Microbulbifer sp. THAF38]
MVEIESPTKAHLPIREVARRTGVHPVTLRAWERRYGLLTPARTGKGHRLYSEEEIRRIEEVLACLARGVAIGRVRELLERGPASLVATEQAENTAGSWREIIDEAYDLSQDFADLKLRQRLDQWIAAFPPALLLDHWLKPLHAKLARQRQSEPAQHFFWQLFYEQLLLANGIARKNLGKDRVTCEKRVLLLDFPGNDQRAFIQLFCATLLAAGCDVVVLDYRAALLELESTVKKLNVDAVLCYSHRALSKAFLHKELPSSIQILQTPLWLLGDFVEMQSAELGRLKKLPIISMLSGDTDGVMRQLREQLKR